MEETGSRPNSSNSFVDCLKIALEGIHREECPAVQNPPGCKKRASVAVIIRIRPSFSEQATYDQSRVSSSTHGFQESLDEFFSQSWVRQGDPEVLLIKRAARVGDRWTSHIALPGGKREPNDMSDRSTSVRETKEETGVELDIDHCLYVGNLPERTITAAWAKVPLMVLCPFVFLQMRHDLPPLALQPSEVHSAHWVSLKGLLLPPLRRDVFSDVSGFTRQRTPFMRILIRAAVGQFAFAAVKLRPAESLYSTSIHESISENKASSHFSRFLVRVVVTKQKDDEDQPLLLWGLTLGIMADLLEKIDMPATSKLWSWPTFSPWDIRFVIWLLNRKFQAQKIQELCGPARQLDTHEADGIQIGGLDNTTYSTSVKRSFKGSEAGVTGMILLASYTDRLRRAVIIAMLLRLTFGTAFTVSLLRKYRKNLIMPSWFRY